MEKTILFCCSCGLPLAAVLLGPGPGRGAEVRFYRRTGRRERIDACPNCQNDFSEVTVEEFLSKVWS